MIAILDGLLWGALDYRDEMLASSFSTVAGFDGIAHVDNDRLPKRIVELFPQLTPTLSILRKSPLGQAEPNYIHNDIDMGEWTAIFYLNPAPPDGDGTFFWRHIATGELESAVQEPASWATKDFLLHEFVPARFNRMIIFPASCYHSRAIEENYGSGDGARLIQVVFGTGKLWQ